MTTIYDKIDNGNPECVKEITTQTPVFNLALMISKNKNESRDPYSFFFIV